MPSSATGATISATLVTAGLQTFTVTATEASGCRSTTTLSVSVVDGVGITAQPTGSSAICAGISVTVPVSVTGAVQGYQWYKGSTPVVSQTTATLTLPAVITNQSGVYVLIVQSSACSSVTSTSFSLVVSEVVAIVAQPVVSSVVCSGASITIPVSVTGSGASYQWYKGSTPISNQFSATLSLSALQTTDGGSYSLVITGGCNSVTSSAFSLTVNYSPILSISPSVTTIMGGQSTTLTVAGADSYTWSTPSNNSAIVVSPTATTIYSVTGTQNDCIGLATATVSVTCSALIVADAISVIAVGQLGPKNCTIMLTGTGYGTGYTITGPNGYVFSAVYRRVGNYQINGLAIKSPGTYTLTVSYSDACGRSSTDMLTYEVIGEACR